MVSLGQCYRLLDQFGEDRNQYAPVFYKLLIFSLIENHIDLMTREYMMKNMLDVIQNHNTIPLGTLVEPLVKQLHTALDTTYLPNVFDFEFFTALSRHSKLQVKHGILMLDLLSKIFLNDVDWASCCMKPFLIIVSRFMNYMPVREFLKQFFKISFGELLHLEKTAKKKNIDPDDSDNDILLEINGLRYATEQVSNSVKVYPPFMRHADDTRMTNARRNMKKAYIVRMARKILDVRHMGVNSDVKDRALETNRINIKMYETHNKALLKILEFFGNPHELFDEYYTQYKIRKGISETSSKHQDSEAESLPKRNFGRRGMSISSSSDIISRGGANTVLSSDNSNANYPQMTPNNQQSLTHKIERAKKNAQSSRNLSSSRRERKHKKKSKRRKYDRKYSDNKLFKVEDDDMVLRQDTFDDDSSQSSEEARTHLPPIKRKIEQPHEYKEKAKTRRVHDSPPESHTSHIYYDDSDGAMTLQALKKKRKMQVQSHKKLPTNKLDKRAFKDIEKMQKSHHRRKKIKEYERHQSRNKSERERIVLKNELDRRKDILGVTSNDFADGLKQIIFDIGDPQVRRYEKWQEKIVKDIELLDIESEEPREKYGVLLEIKKYNKLLKFLFKKYANSGHSLIDVSNFDNMSKKAATINRAELLKMLKDHNVSDKDINVKELSRLVQLVSTKIMKKTELHSLDKGGFIQFFIQLAHLLYTRPPNDLSHLPPVEHLRELIKKFKLAAKSRGENAVLYEDTDATFITDKSVLKELNLRVLDDPTYQVPDGYYKYNEKNMKMYYGIPNYFPISEAQNVSTCVLDHIISVVFDFHFLEPVTMISEVTKVKPSFKKLAKPLPSTVRHRNKSKSGEINPIVDDRSKSKKRSQSRKREVKPKLSTNMKLLVAKAPFEERAYVNEVAEVLEEILVASEFGYKQLPSRKETRVGNINNKIKNDELKRAEQEKKMKEERDLKIRKHHQELKENMERLRLEKIKNDEEIKRQEIIKRKSELQQQQKQENNRKQYLEDQKKKIEQKRKEELDEIEVQLREEEEKNKKKKEVKKKEHHEFLKEQKQKIKKDFKKRAEERKQLQDVQTQLEYKEMMKKQKIMDNMLKFIKSHKQDKEMIELQKENLTKFWLQNQQVFDDNEDLLFRLFNNYARQNVKTLDGNLENNMNSLDMFEFIKFANKSKLVPHFLANQSLLQIFQFLAKERADKAGPDDELGLVLDFEHFRKALIFIGIEGREMLGGSRKSKEEEAKELKSKRLEKVNSKEEMKITKKSPRESVKDTPTKTLEGKKIKEIEKKVELLLNLYIDAEIQHQDR